MTRHATEVRKPTQLGRPQPCEVPPVPVRRFTVFEYQRMYGEGIISPGERVELLDGWIVPKCEQSPPHASAVRVIDRWLRRQVAGKAVVRTRAPIVLADSEVEPDVSVVRLREHDYRDRHPDAADTILVVEVADVE